MLHFRAEKILPLCFRCRKNMSKNFDVLKIFCRCAFGAEKNPSKLTKELFASAAMLSMQKKTSKNFDV